MTEKRKRLGERGEEAAAAYLERCGMTVVERNWRAKAGEVDIVALDGDTVVLVEVKTRKTVSKGTPEDAVTLAKQRTYRKLAEAYTQHAGLAERIIRFDVISILVIAADRALLRHHRSAFVCDGC